MRRSTLLAAAAVLALSIAGCSQGAQQETTAAGADYAAALAEPSRPAEDRARDAARHTEETLAFAQVQPGQTVVDMIIGGGYFTRVFSAAVGPEGRVIAWQPAELIAYQASYGESLTAVDALANVDGIRSSRAAPVFPAGVDLVFTSQNYHDLHLATNEAGTASKVNAAVFNALKPGGLYVVIDHNAAAGAPLTTSDTLHRIDIETVKREVLAAGFVLDGESDVLANAVDPLTNSVFDPAIQGRTSQFMLRFKKPA